MGGQVAGCDESLVGGAEAAWPSVSRIAFFLGFRQDPVPTCESPSAQDFGLAAVHRHRWGTWYSQSASERRALRINPQELRKQLYANAALLNFLICHSSMAALLFLLHQTKKNVLSQDARSLLYW